MDIKLDVKMEQVARAIAANMKPLGFGQLVFAWDNDKSYIVCGAHLGYDKHYDSETGELIYKRHKVEVYSWSDNDKCAHAFDNAVPVKEEDLPIVITEDGTGRLVNIDGHIYTILDFKTQSFIKVPKDNVIMFDWNKLKGDNK